MFSNEINNVLDIYLNLDKICPIYFVKYIYNVRYTIESDCLILYNKNKISENEMKEAIIWKIQEIKSFVD